MEGDSLRSLSMRASRRIASHNKDVDLDSLLKTAQDPMKGIWKRGFIRLVFVSAIVWMLLILVALLFHVWSCRSSISFFSALCKRDSRVLGILDNMGLTAAPPQHRCPIPLKDDPDAVVIPERTPDVFPETVSYLLEDRHKGKDNQTTPLFGGHQSWEERNKSFKLKKNMKVHCGFMKNGGADMDDIDIKFARNCRFVVASGIFDGYDTPHQPSNISRRSQELFCFLMVVDEVSLNFIMANVTINVDKDGGKWVGIWRLMTLHHPPYDEPRRNGKVPKILTHRLFPQAQYSIWIDAFWCILQVSLAGKHTFAVARHKHHISIYEEADAIKRRKRYARPLIDLHMKIYRNEGMEPWSPKKKTISDVPEGAVLIREHTAMTNLFSCLWFNEVNLFTPRDQLSFGYVAYRLGDAFKFLMFPNCEYNSLFILHKHTREHSSKVEWVKSLDELTGYKAGLKETRGGLGLWTPYPGDLESVNLPPVARTSAAA